MKKQWAALLGGMLLIGMLVSGCGSTGDAGDAESSAASSQDDAGSAESSIPQSDATELAVQFGDAGEPFILHLEDNSTAAAIAGYVGTADWRLPVYSFDESDVMEYYDIPSRYEIPDNSEHVTEAQAGDVFYSDPNRIVLYYQDAEVSEDYTKVGSFDATEEFVSAVENNPVLEGWGNQIIIIRAGA